MAPLEGALVESSWPISSPGVADLEEVGYLFFIFARSPSFVLEFIEIGFGSLEHLLTGHLSANLNTEKM